MALRRHPVSGDAILFAPGRAGRPNAFGRVPGADVCPFCPGNESQTPPEIARRGDPWRVRVFPNKYPAVEGHEVIVDSNRHDASFDSLENAPEVVATWVDRYRAHADAAYVSLFKNEGERAGASIDHIHSQLMPLTFVPPRIERELAAFARAASCPLCAPAGVILDENEAFTRISPSGSQFAYEQWIVPKRHQADIGSLRADEIDSLATMLRTATRAVRTIGTSHNVLFMNFPRHAAAHFYIDVFPRLTSIAGFELATGTFIDIIDPAAAARRLR
jgi:UDPglucose--hexose-1-phosphate uridylyltransferase